VTYALTPFIDGFIYLPDSAEMLQEANPHHAGLPEIEGYEKLMWALCQHLKKDKGVRGEDGPSNTLPVGNVSTRGKSMRGTLPYMIGKSVIGSFVASGALLILQHQRSKSGSQSSRSRRNPRSRRKSRSSHTSRRESSNRLSPML
jgi:hypothetical protein